MNILLLTWKNSGIGIDWVRDRENAAVIDAANVFGFHTLKILKIKIMSD